MRTPIAASVLALCLFACGKEEAKPAESAPEASAPAATTPPEAAAPPSEPSAAASASAPSVPLPKCPTGLTGNAVPAFCIKLPGEYKVKDARTSADHGSIAYDTGTTTDIFSIAYDATPLAQEAKDVEGEMKFGGDKLEKKGDLPGGGKWFKGSHADFARVVTLVKGPSGLTLKCSFAYQPKKAPSQIAIDACKSIVLP